MIAIALIVKLILNQLVLALLHDLQLALELFVGLLLRLEDVARVVAASLRAVQLPLRQAEPAEVVLAFLTRDVIASLVLLDVRVTFGARLGVRSEPLDIFSFVGLLLDPLFREFARCWNVVFLPALEAESRAALAGH